MGRVHDRGTADCADRATRLHAVQGLPGSRPGHLVLLRRPSYTVAHRLRQDDVLDAVGSVAVPLPVLRVTMGRPRRYRSPSHSLPASRGSAARPRWGTPT